MTYKKSIQQWTRKCPCTLLWQILEVSTSNLNKIFNPIVREPSWLCCFKNLVNFSTHYSSSRTKCVTSARCVNIWLGCQFSSSAAWVWIPSEKLTTTPFIMPCSWSFFIKKHREISFRSEIPKNMPFSLPRTATELKIEKQLK